MFSIGASVPDPEHFPFKIMKMTKSYTRTYTIYIYIFSVIIEHPNMIVNIFSYKLYEKKKKRGN